MNARAEHAAHPHTLHRGTDALRIAQQCRADDPEWSYSVIECPSDRGNSWYVVQVRDEAGDIVGYL